MLSNGAGVVVLEEYEHARKRGAKIYAELIGYGRSADAYHMTSPPEGGEGAARCMRNAINDAGLNLEEVDYINAHGTLHAGRGSCRMRSRSRPVRDHAGQMMISSTKSMTGHLLGAAGGVEAIFTILALHDQVVPPTINLDNPDPACAGLDLVPHEARSANIKGRAVQLLRIWRHQRLPAVCAVFPDTASIDCESPLPR